MPKKAKAKGPQTQRPKGPGAEPPAAKRAKRERRPAATASELAGPTAQRCGRDDCLVCKPKACNKCAACKASPKPTAGRCNEAKKLREKSCPNMAPAPRDDGVDQRKLDEEGPHFKASTEIIRVMDALANSTKLESEDLYALACFKDSLKKSGRLDARWASLAKIKARGDYDVDDINADNGAQKAIEAAVRSVHFKDGSQPSVEEMAKMGPLEMRTVVRVLSYIASIKKRTRAQSRARTAAMRQSQSDEARDTFLAFVEGRKYDGVHVCTTLARGEKSWPAYWEWCQTFLAKTYDACTLPQGEARFYRLLKRVRSGAPAWACAPEMRKWFQDRQCRYQRMMVSTTCHW